MKIAGAATNMCDRKEEGRRYRAKHKTQIKAWQQAWATSHKEERRIHKQQYYKENKWLKTHNKRRWKANGHLYRGGSFKNFLTGALNVAKRRDKSENREYNLDINFR